MPNKISRWPRSPDPRHPSHLLVTSDSRGAGPWRVKIRSPGASGDLSALSSGLLLVSDSNHPSHVSYHPLIALPGGWTCVLAISATNHFDPWVEPVTVRYQLDIANVSTTYQGVDDSISPDLLNYFPLLEMTVFGVDPGLITNSVVVVPKPWDAV